MSDTSLTPQQSFEEKIKDRIRKDIGDLIPDDVLKQMTEKATQEIFFSKRYDTSGYNRKELPSWFEEHVGVLLRDRVGEQIRDSLSSKKDEIEKLVIDSLKEKMPELIAGFFFETLSKSASNIALNTSTSLQSIILERLNKNQIY